MRANTQFLCFLRRRFTSVLSTPPIPIPKPYSSPSPVFLNPKSHFSNRPSSQSQSPEPRNLKPLPESDLQLLIEPQAEATNTTSSVSSSNKKTPEDSMGTGEGFIIKTLNEDATDEPSKRSETWLKVMKAFMGTTFFDSFDLVSIGAFHGTGKRTGFYDAFLLACYDKDKEEYQTICKLPCSRFSDAQLEDHFMRLRSKVIAEPKSYFRFGEKLIPDVWFEPSEVWAVRGRLSPGLASVDPNEGISLWFPRMLGVRRGRHPKDASSPHQVAEAEMNVERHLNLPSPLDFGHKKKVEIGYCWPFDPGPTI